MELKDFLIEQWLNPMDSKAKHNLGSSCVKAMTMDELFRVTGQDEEAFLKEMSTMSLHYHHGDSTGSPRVKKAVCGLYPKGNVKPEHVMMVHGGTGANDIVICGLMEHGDNIVVVKPTYQQQYDIPKSLGMETRELMLKEEEDYILNMDDLREMVDKNTKLIALSNPNNPTGQTLYDKELKELVEIAKSVDAYILCDEIYRGMDEEYMPSIMDYGYDKCISISSMSKMFSMAGTRIGWIVAKDEYAYRNFENRRSYNTICCGIMDENVASVALENYEKVWARARSILVPNKKIVYDWINAHPHLHVRGDAKGTTCLVRYDYDIESTALAVDAMETAQILFCHGACFEMPGYIRIGYGAFGDPQKLREALAALGEYLKKYEQ
ncbi:MAG: aminotransferase class I/II-fold pyridoxal phosphate-dependent enzyme [Eubacteriales bacterium]|nr:aminotransferase class I/II-fold pyridoxal phosphate-dependent enzyme [Eubacteriales bacterium]MDD3290857.1 aminotransferase class I/II-fold pyridoxal phosphate-dependent enzyme [Eubacteriales bacterium]MDD3863927.1 aminotransferase class I/II-fold pyridoxal phosphate-dependent enzyme [Eubacteriales bacterium]